MAHLPLAQRLRLIEVLLRYQNHQALQDFLIIDYLLHRDDNRPRRRARAIWVRQWLLNRPLYGHYERLLTELSMTDPVSFRNFTRLPSDLFEELLHRIGANIEARNTRWRRALPAGLKLAVTLRYLATGDSYTSLSYAFRVSVSSISKMIPQVCQALINELGQELLDTPVTPAAWLAMEEQFRLRWQVPHAVGAIDGKHVRIKCPARGGSVFFNYKDFHSIILMALVDAEYRFRWVDIGVNGAASDCQVFNHSRLKRYMEQGRMGFPAPFPLPGDNENISCFILSDDAFPLLPWMMKPFPGKILTRDEKVYNYRISRGRRVVENAFGILANRFRCLHTPLSQKLKHIRQIVAACVVLHNLIRLRFPHTQHRYGDVPGANGRVIPGLWRQGLRWDDVANVRAPNVDTLTAKKVRLTLKKYYNSNVGAVPWQYDRIR